jgi:hypothetical protein
VEEIKWEEEMVAGRRDINSTRNIVSRCGIKSMLSGSTVTTAWHVLGLRIEETASRYGG